MHLPEPVLQILSERSRTCIERLSGYRRDEPNLSDHPTSKLAAVLVLLYEQSGQLRVVLTTRSKLLRSHPGQTAFPGGKVDTTDADVFETAHREAYEEVAMPLSSPEIFDICLLEPFYSSTRLLVTPVVAFLSNPALLNNLKPAEREVAYIFDHPLEAILDPSLAEYEPLVPIGSENWPYETPYHYTNDVPVSTLGGALYRMHRFRSRASPIKGLTADIMIKTAEIAYSKTTAYDRYAPTQAQDFFALARLLELDQGQIEARVISVA